MRNSQLLGVIDATPPAECVMKTIPQAIRRTTTVLTAVARLESTPSIPTFANIEVAAANTAERIAYVSYMFFFTVQRINLVF